MFNVAYLDELAEWKLDQKFNKGNAITQGGMISTHLVYFPSYLNVRVLPKEFKLFAKSKIEKFIDRQKFNTQWIQHPMGQKRWQGLIDYMCAEEWSEKLPQTKDYLRVLDKNRGTDFTKTFPELGEAL